MILLQRQEPAEGGGGHRMFLSAEYFPTHIDTVCAQEANINGLNGVWKAIYTTATVNARDRIQLNGPVTPIGETLPIAEGATFWTGSFSYAMNRNVEGNLITIGNFFYSSTLANGSYSWNGDCDGWESENGFSTAGVTAILDGTPFSVNGILWYDGAQTNCDQPKRFLCIDGQ
jgi:hypothetical protein